jgi:sortase (surface protein transpeptidase)
MSKKKPGKIKGVIKIGKQKRGIVFLSRPSTLSVIFSSLAIILLVAGLTIGGIPVIWMVWYRISPDTSSAMAQVLMRPVVGFGQVLRTGQNAGQSVYQPPLDETLPHENRLIIKKLGIDTAINEEPLATYEEAFKKGVWRVPDFGTPQDRQLPLILAAHRFGYISWSNDFRHKNSFFNLPKLEPGDQVDVIWNQRHYTYQIYAGEESKEISQYTADLILYTCKFLESDVRIFRYGRLIERQYFDLGQVATVSATPKR